MCVSWLLCFVSGRVNPDVSEQREYSILGERKTFLRPSISPLLCGLMVTTVDDVVSAIGAHRLQAI